MMHIMSDGEVQQTVDEMRTWVDKQLKKADFGLVYQILWDIKQHFERIEEDKLTPDQRKKRAEKWLKKHKSLYK